MLLSSWSWLLWNFNIGTFPEKAGPSECPAMAQRLADMPLISNDFVINKSFTKE
jgi:hypothetical protein